MASAREVKRRIKSVKNTMQITRAMQMIAATKMRKAQDVARTTQEYAEGIFEIVNKIGNVPSDYQSSFFKRSKKIKNVGIILVGPFKGFSGSLPNNLLVHTDQFIQSLSINPRYQKSKYKIIAVNKVGHKLAQNMEYENVASFLDLTDSPTLNDVEPIYRYIADQFKNEDFDEIFISYPKFISTLKQEPFVQKILPIMPENLIDEKSTGSSNEPLFEPSVTQLLDELIPKYLRIQIYQALLNLVASEYSSRMVAMKNATDNAKDLVAELTIVYNQSRQDSITRELLEITSSV